MRCRQLLNCSFHIFIRHCVSSPYGCLFISKRRSIWNLGRAEVARFHTSLAPHSRSTQAAPRLPSPAGPSAAELGRPRVRVACSDRPSRAVFGPKRPLDRPKTLLCENDLNFKMCARKILNNTPFQVDQYILIL